MAGSRKRAGDIALFIIALGCTALIAGCARDSSLQIGERAPEISVLDLNDRTVKLSDFRGNVVIVRFWSNGCRACAAEMPLLGELGTRYVERGLVILAVNLGDPKGDVEIFVKELKISYPVLLDPLLIAAGKFGVKAVPTTFFVDRDGIARKVLVGGTTQELFEKTLVSLL